jgi:phosphoserine phosphatase
MCGDSQSGKKVLAVDLDLSLARTDTLVEGIWSLFLSNPFQFVKIMLSLRRGRAYFKNLVAESVSFDAAKLPFNKEVLHQIKAWKRDGGRVVLVTASHQLIADEVGRHLNLFDRVQGSTEAVNLKGQQKAKFLCEEFGLGEFAYIGDSKADLPVWEVACSVIAVNPSFGLKLQLDNKFDNVKYLLSSESKRLEVLRLLRPAQWVKKHPCFRANFSRTIPRLGCMAKQCIRFHHFLHSRICYLHHE